MVAACPVNICPTMLVDGSLWQAKIPLIITVLELFSPRLTVRISCIIRAEHLFIHRRELVVSLRLLDAYLSADIVQSALTPFIINFNWVDSSLAAKLHKILLFLLLICLQWTLWRFPSRGILAIWIIEELLMFRVFLNIFPTGIAPSAGDEMHIRVQFIRVLLLMSHLILHVVVLDVFFTYLVHHILGLLLIIILAKILLNISQYVLTVPVEI